MRLSAALFALAVSVAAAPANAQARGEGVTLRREDGGDPRFYATLTVSVHAIQDSLARLRRQPGGDAAPPADELDFKTGFGFNGALGAKLGRLPLAAEAEIVSLFEGRVRDGAFEILEEEFG